MMTTGNWITLAGVVLSALTLAVYIGKKFGEQAGIVVTALRDHEKDCVNYEEKEKTQPKIVIAIEDKAAP